MKIGGFILIVLTAGLMWFCEAFPSEEVKPEPEEPSIPIKELTAMIPGVWKPVGDDTGELLYISLNEDRLSGMMFQTKENTDGTFNMPSNPEVLDISNDHGLLVLKRTGQYDVRTNLVVSATDDELVLSERGVTTTYRLHKRTLQ